MVGRADWGDETIHLRVGDRRGIRRKRRAVVTFFDAVHRKTQAFPRQKSLSSRSTREYSEVSTGSLRPDVDMGLVVATVALAAAVLRFPRSCERSYTKLALSSKAT
jgi:hypothetical protein